jgi:hypothetical protein
MQPTQDRIMQERGSVEKLTTRRGQISEESSSQLEEEGNYLEAWQESHCHRHHQKRSESSMMSVSTTCFFFANVHDDDGAAEVDSSGASVKSRPGYSPSLGWGG